MTKFVRGYKKRIFKKIRDRNEALDCFVYALAALSILNLDVNSLADKLKFKHNNSIKPPADSDKKRKKPPFVPRTGTGFVNSWR